MHYLTMKYKVVVLLAQRQWRPVLVYIVHQMQQKAVNFDDLNSLPASVGCIFVVAIS